VSVRRGDLPRRVDASPEALDALVLGLVGLDRRDTAVWSVRHRDGSAFTKAVWP
jgi:hypothetical protein